MNDERKEKGFCTPRIGDLQMERRSSKKKKKHCSAAEGRDNTPLRAK